MLLPGWLRRVFRDRIGPLLDDLPAEGPHPLVPAPREES